MQGCNVRLLAPLRKWLCDITSAAPEEEPPMSREVKKSFLVRSLLARRMTYELIPAVRMESQHSIGAPTCHHVPRFVIISEKSRPEVGNRWRWSRFFGKRPLKGKFSKKNYSEGIHQVTESRLVCKFREIWLTGNRQSRALFTWHTKAQQLLRWATVWPQ